MQLPVETRESRALKSKFNLRWQAISRLPMMLRKILQGLALVGTLSAALNGGPASALLRINIYDSGSGVSASFNGSVNTNGLTPYASSSIIGGIGASFGIAWSSSITSGVPSNIWSGLTPPDPFAFGPLIFPQVDNGGDPLFLRANYIDLPTGYVSGTSISNSMFFTGQTFASIGLMPGTYTWAWGSGPNVDSAVMTISTSEVPGPLPLLGVGAAFGWSRRLRRLCRRGSSAAFDSDLQSKPDHSA